MNDLNKGKIVSYCEFVSRGKPTAMMPLQDRYIEEAESIINKNNLFAYIEDLSEGWKTIWIYKEKYMLEIIKNLPEQPKTVFDHWILGKAFGYSDESIKKFIGINQLL
ncbi:hypothetical protein Ccar_16615 [Clostridium carboxidivorans P7]|uniref:hypothetical protein n=1 Tax=Clostridium carboxidivorans TaxID=217159 RepID=UPI00064F27B9|nr:hypothetical protein [Clostridium carboxidivorans]AKN32395.1 hypothetical protein Ccar_16615 [Clostridium carboxidivorans P7]